MYSNTASKKAKTLRYGENPHQIGIYFGKFDELFDQICGKEISYNNLLDIDAAVNLIGDFSDTTFAILKHNNACGIAISSCVNRCMERCFGCRSSFSFWWYFNC